MNLNVLKENQAKIIPPQLTLKKRTDFYLKHDITLDEIFKELKELINSFDDDDDLKYFDVYF